MGGEGLREESRIVSGTTEPGPEAAAATEEPQRNVGG